MAEASRSLPSVKADIEPADDDIVTSVAFTAPDDGEPVSPELALVDPVLAERLRTELPAAPAPIEEPEPEAEAGDVAEPAAEPEPADASVHVLRLAPTLDEGGQEPADVDSASAIPVPVAAPRPVAPHPRSSAVRRTLLAFLAGAIVASLVVVGVIAELGETDGSATSNGAVPETVTPSVAPPPVASSAPSPPPSVSPAPPKAAASKPTAKPKPRTKQTAASQKANAKPRPAPTTKRRSAPRAQTAPPRRFAWAPVEGAVRYRVELFRGNQQVLSTTTKQPVFELASQWRHQGRAERLTPGAYRWYVWPVLKSGPAAKAVVQARLDVP